MQNKNITYTTERKFTQGQVEELFLGIGQVSGAALSGSSAFFLCAYGVGRRSAGGAGPGIG